MGRAASRRDVVDSNADLYTRGRQDGVAYQKKSTTFEAKRQTQRASRHPSSSKKACQRGAYLLVQSRDTEKLSQTPLHRNTQSTEGTKKGLRLTATRATPSTAACTSCTCKSRSWARRRSEAAPSRRTPPYYCRMGTSSESRITFRRQSRGQEIGATSDA